MGKKGFLNSETIEEKKEREAYEKSLKSLAIRCAEGFISSDGPREDPNLFCIYGVDDSSLDIAEASARRYFNSHGRKDVVIEREKNEKGYSTDLGALLKMNGVSLEEYEF